MEPFGHKRYRPKIGKLRLLFGEGGWVPMQHKVPWAEAYSYTQWHLDASCHLAIIKMGRKLGWGLCPSPFFFEEVWVVPI